MKPAVASILALVTAGMLAGPAAGSAAVRIAVKSGTPQSAHAMAPAGTNDYETTFATPLVVTVSPPDAKIRFRCITPGCSLPPQEQGEGINRHDAASFDVDADKGIASIKLVVRSASVQRLTVVAEPAAGRGAPARFTLIAR